MPENPDSWAETSTIVEKDRKVIQKKYDISGSGLTVNEIQRDYTLCHSRMAGVYMVPELVSIDSPDNHTLIVKETKVEGTDGSIFLTTADKDSTQKMTQRTILPLLLTLQEPMQISPRIRSEFPTRICIDFKPDNFILTDDGTPFFVDFFPPRLRGENGSVYPYSKIFDPVPTDKQALIWGDLSFLIPRYIKSAAKVATPENTVLVANTSLEAANNVPSGDRLIQNIKHNVSKGRFLRSLNSTEAGRLALQSILKF